MASDAAARSEHVPSPPRRRLLRQASAAALGSVLPWTPVLADPVPFADPLSRPATRVEAASRCVLLGLAKAGERLVACGERGIIVYSDNAGGSWQQAQVPVSVTLTAVSFPRAGQGWAVGHGGVVLHSADGGATWVRQSTGAADHERERVLLDVQFDDVKTGIAVGAFGLIMRTADGGKSWRTGASRLDNPKGMHFYAVRTRRAMTYVAGEQGFFARSADGGETFERIATPYTGTYFSMAITGDRSVFVGGLRGNVLRLREGATSFDSITGPAKLSITSLQPLVDNALLVVNQGGDLMLLPAGATSMTPIGSSRVPLATALRLADGSFAAVGLFGATRIAAAPPTASGSSGGKQ